MNCDGQETSGTHLPERLLSFGIARKSTRRRSLRSTGQLLVLGLRLEQQSQQRLTRINPLEHGRCYERFQNQPASETCF